MLVAPAPLPTMMSMRKSSIARYSISSAERAIRCTSSMKSTSPGREARQERRQVARVLDRRTAGHPQRPAALVRDDHRERRLAEPGRAGQQDVVGGALLDARRVQQQLELPAHLLLTDELGEGCRPQRALDREFGLVDGLVGVAESSTGVLLPRRARAWRASGAAGRGRRRARPGVALSTAARTASAAARSLQPSPMSACVTCAATPGAASAPERTAERGAATLPASWTTMSFAVFGPMPETRRNGASSSAPTASAIWATLSAASTPSADFGPDAGHAEQLGEDDQLIAGLEAEQRQRVLADDEVRVQVHLVADVRGVRRRAG